MQSGVCWVLFWVRTPIFQRAVSKHDEKSTGKSPPLSNAYNMQDGSADCTAELAPCSLLRMPRGPPFKMVAALVPYLKQRGVAAIIERYYPILDVENTGYRNVVYNFVLRCQSALVLVMLNEKYSIF
jgi:hypothetical protein